MHVTHHFHEPHMVSIGQTLSITQSAYRPEWIWRWQWQTEYSRAGWLK